MTPEELTAKLEELKKYAGKIPMKTTLQEEVSQCGELVCAIEGAVQVQKKLLPWLHKKMWNVASEVDLKIN